MASPEAGHSPVVEEEWECAESVELNLWARVFTAHQERFPQEDVDELGKPLSQLFDSIAQLALVTFGEDIRPHHRRVLPRRV